MPFSVPSPLERLQANRVYRAALKGGLHGITSCLPFAGGGKFTQTRAHSQAQPCSLPLETDCVYVYFCSNPSSLTVGIHLGPEASRQATRRAPVPARLVDLALPAAGCNCTTSFNEKPFRMDGLEARTDITSRTDACVDDSLPDAPLEEAGAAVAAVDAVVLPVRLVTAHLAQDGHG